MSSAAVNRWEWACVHDRDRRPVEETEARGLLAHALGLYGVREVPRIVYRSHRTEREFPVIHGSVVAWVALGTETLYVNKPHMFSASVLLHETAHMLTEDPLLEMELLPSGDKDVHGPTFYANFISLLHQTMGLHTAEFSKTRLMATLAQADPSFARSVKWHPTVRGVAMPRL